MKGLTQWFEARDRVSVTGSHFWSGYTGEVVGRWPGWEFDWLVRLDNGQLTGTKTDHLRLENTSPTPETD